jgi:hypothetical protein
MKLNPSFGGCVCAANRRWCLPMGSERRAGFFEQRMTRFEGKERT